METRQLGSLEVSLVGLGCNNFGRKCDASQTALVVGAAIDEGIDFFDTADVYGDGMSEEFLGKALSSKRDGVRIATKFGHQMGADPSNKGGRPRWIKTAVEGSLRRLGTDRIDLYQMHVPDQSVPIEETLFALNDLIKEGKVVEIGCSNYSGEQIEEAVKVAAEANLKGFISAQNHYSLLNRDPEVDVLPACSRGGLGVLPYFPLASGLLTGKYSPGVPAPEGTRLASARGDRFLNDKNFEIVEKLEEFAASKGHSLLELAVSWLATNPLVSSVIAGATSPGQVRSNAAAAGWRLSIEEREFIDTIAPAE